MHHASGILKAATSCSGESMLHFYKTTISVTQIKNNNKFDLFNHHIGEEEC